MCDVAQESALKITIDIKPGQAKHYDALEILLNKDDLSWSAYGHEVIERLDEWFDYIREGIVEDEDFDSYKTALDRARKWLDDPI